MGSRRSRNVEIYPYVKHYRGWSTFYETSAYSETLHDYKEAARVDASSRYGTLFGYYFLDNYSFTNPYGAAASAGANSVPGFSAITTGRAQMANLGLTTTCKSSAVNTFRFTYMRSATHPNHPTASPVQLSSLGFVTPWGPAGGIDTIYTHASRRSHVNFDNCNFGNPTETQAKFNNTFQWLDNYLKVIGTHTLEFGGNYHYDQIMERNNYAVNGLFSSMELRQVSILPTT